MESMNYRVNNCLGKHSREMGKLKEDRERYQPLNSRITKGISCV